MIIASFSFNTQLGGHDFSHNEGERLTSGGIKYDSDFVLLVGRTFLQELSLGNRDEAIAFGRALLALMAS